MDHNRGQGQNMDRRDELQSLHSSNEDLRKTIEMIIEMCNQGTH